MNKIDFKKPSDDYMAAFRIPQHPVESISMPSLEFSARKTRQVIEETATVSILSDGSVRLTGEWTIAELEQIVEKAREAAKLIQVTPRWRDKPTVGSMFFHRAPSDPAGQYKLVSCDGNGEVPEGVYYGPIAHDGLSE